MVGLTPPPQDTGVSSVIYAHDSSWPPSYTETTSTWSEEPWLTFPLATTDAFTIVYYNPLDRREVRKRYWAWLQDTLWTGPIFVPPLPPAVPCADKRVTWFTQVSHKKARPRIHKWRNAA